MISNSISLSDLNNMLKRPSLYASRDWQGNVIIRDCSITDSVDFSLAPKSSSSEKYPFFFIRCTFEGETSFDTSGFEDGLFFKDCTFNKSATFTISGIFSFNGNCRFNDVVHFNFTAEATGPTADVSFEDLTFHSDVIIKGSAHSLKLFNIHHLPPEKTENYKDVSFLFQAMTCHHLSITQSHFHLLNFLPSVMIQSDVNIHGVTCESMSCHGLNVLGKASISNVTAWHILLNTEHGTVRQLVLNKLQIGDELKMKLDNYVQTLISDCNIERLELSGRNKPEAVLSLNSSTINHLSFENVANQGSISIREIESRIGTLRIYSSNLGKTDFLVSDFSNAVLDFENSKMVEVFLSETEFPKKVVRNGKISHQQAQLAFGQINTAYQKQGDTVRALEYQAREIESHYRDLRHQKKLTQTTINLHLNRLSNDFGRSWARGIIFTLGCAIIFFSLIVLSSPDYRLVWPQQFDTTLIPAFFKFLNPFRFSETETLFKIPDRGNINLPLWTSIVDFIGRILITYGIYQTIQAFRRYGRK